MHLSHLFIKFIQEVFHLLTQTSLLGTVKSQKARHKFVKGCIESPLEVFACDPMKFFRDLKKNNYKEEKTKILSFAIMDFRANNSIKVSQSSHCNN